MGEIQINRMLKEFDAGNDRLSFTTFDIVGGEGLHRWEKMYYKSEELYQQRMRFDILDHFDETGYSDSVRLMLERLSYCLRFRRRRRFFRYYASQFGMDLNAMTDEFDVYNHYLRRDSVEVETLLGEEQIQIRYTADLDVALFLIQGNTDAENLPVFLFPSRHVYRLANRLALGRFRCIVKRQSAYEWGTAIVVGGMDPPANTNPDWEGVAPAGGSGAAGGSGGSAGELAPAGGTGMIAE